MLRMTTKFCEEYETKKKNWSLSLKRKTKFCQLQKYSFKKMTIGLPNAEQLFEQLFSVRDNVPNICLNSNITVVLLMLLSMYSFSTKLAKHKDNVSVFN